VATGLLLGFAAVFMAAGLVLTRQPDCQGLCETGAITLLYAGGPISALLGVVFGGVIVAWPLDVTLWVVLGFFTARMAERRRVPASVAALLIVAAALVYGLVLSQFVEIGL
jgi:hypothetical protein